MKKYFFPNHIGKMAQAYVDYIFTMILDRGTFNTVSYGDVEDFSQITSGNGKKAYVDYIFTMILDRGKVLTQFHTEISYRDTNNNSHRRRPENCFAGIASKKQSTFRLQPEIRRQKGDSKSPHVMCPCRWMEKFLQPFLSSYGDVEDFFPNHIRENGASLPWQYLHNDIG